MSQSLAKITFVEIIIHLAFKYELKTYLTLIELK
jgi:hypothetical protein